MQLTDGQKQTRPTRAVKSVHTSDHAAKADNSFKPVINSGTRIHNFVTGIFSYKRNTAGLYPHKIVTNKYHVSAKDKAHKPTINRKNRQKIGSYKEQREVNKVRINAYEKHMKMLDKSAKATGRPKSVFSAKYMADKKAIKKLDHDDSSYSDKIDSIQHTGAYKHSKYAKSELTNGDKKLNPNTKRSTSKHSTSRHSADVDDKSRFKKSIKVPKSDAKAYKDAVAKSNDKHLSSAHRKSWVKKAKSAKAKLSSDKSSKSKMLSSNDSSISELSSVKHTKSTSGKVSADSSSSITSSSNKISTASKHPTKHSNNVKDKATKNTPLYVNNIKASTDQSGTTHYYLNANKDVSAVTNSSAAVSTMSSAVGSVQSDVSSNSVITTGVSSHYALKNDVATTPISSKSSVSSAPANATQAHTTLDYQISSTVANMRKQQSSQGFSRMGDTPSITTPAPSVNSSAPTPSVSDVKNVIDTMNAQQTTTSVTSAATKSAVLNAITTQPQSYPTQEISKSQVNNILSVNNYPTISDSRTSQAAQTNTPIIAKTDNVTFQAPVNTQTGSINTSSVAPSNPQFNNVVEQSMEAAKHNADFPNSFSTQRSRILMQAKAKPTSGSNSVQSASASQAGPDL